MGRFRQYLDLLAKTNGLAQGGESVQWLFFPGMLAESRAKWWGDFKHRHADHEGVDICFYRLTAGATPGPATGTVRRLETETTVPAFSRGTIRNICPDFLGHSIVTEPEEFNNGPSRVLLVYSHLSPAAGLTPGTRVEHGQSLARLFDTASKGSILLPHLHLSCIEVPLGTPDAALDWTLFPYRDKVNLINPVFL